MPFHYRYLWALVEKFPMKYTEKHFQYFFVLKWFIGKGKLDQSIRILICAAIKLKTSISSIKEFLIHDKIVSKKACENRGQFWKLSWAASVFPDISLFLPLPSYFRSYYLRCLPFSFALTAAPIAGAHIPLLRQRSIHAVGARFPRNNGSDNYHRVPALLRVPNDLVSPGANERAYLETSCLRPATRANATAGIFIASSACNGWALSLSSFYLGLGEILQERSLYLLPLTSSYFSSPPPFFLEQLKYL